MSINLLEKVRENLGLPELKKIDPNTQQAKVDGNSDGEFRLSQAILPAVLSGIYNLSRTNEGVKQIADQDNTNSWAEIIFEKRVDEIVQNISAYAYTTEATAKNKINWVAATAVKIIREQAVEGDRLTSIKNIIGDQRNNILPFLPAELKVGDLLEDNTLDDRTNKMEGPLSSLMHKIESGFSGNETQEDATRKASEI